MDRSLVLWLFGVPPPLRLFALTFLLLVRVFISFQCKPPCSPACSVPVHHAAVGLSHAFPPPTSAICGNLTFDPSKPPAYSTCLGASYHPHPHPHHYTRAELLAAKTTGTRLDADVISRLKELSLGVNLPRKRSSRGGTRKRRRIETTCAKPDGVRPAVHGPVPPSILSDITSLPPRPQGANLCNLKTVPLQGIPNKLCMCIFNAQSVGPSIKRSAIRDFIHEHDIDIFIITETWLHKEGDEAKISDLTPPGYTPLNCPREQTTKKTKRGGGLAVILKDCLAENCSPPVKNFPFDHVSFELAQLTLTINEQRITLFLVYRPPPSSKNNLTTSLFFAELPDFLDFCLHCQTRVVISGDFNFHVDDATDNNARKLLEQFEMYNLMQTVTEPTRGGHTLDLVVHRNDDDIILSTNVCHDLASDHYAILCHLSTPKPKCPPKCISTRSIGKIDHVEFARDIAQFSTPNLSISEFNSNLSRIFDKHAPVRQIKIRDGKPTPWYRAISSQLRETKIQRRRAERAWKKSRLTVHKEIYDAAKRKVANLVDTAKTAFYSSLVSGSRTCKQLFQNTSRLLGKTKSVSLPSVSDIKILPNMFADFFCNKILTIRNCFPSTSQSHNSLPPFSGTPLSAFVSVTEDVVKKT